MKMRKKEMPQFYRGVRVREMPKDGRTVKKLNTKVESQIEKDLAELRTYLAEDSDMAERIAEGASILADWLRWRINHAATKKAEAAERARAEHSDSREEIKTEITEAVEQPTSLGVKE
jgi:hypothetical protein